MPDIPKFERSQGIKPTNAVTGFSEAMGKVGKASTSALETIASGLAQQSANQYASIQGADAAARDIQQGKSRETIPFSEADKYFAQSYKQNHLAELSFQGQKMLDSHFSTAMQKPTGSSLAEYQQYTQQGIADIVNRAPRSEQAGLRRSLEEAYHSGFLNLSNKVHQADTQYMRSQQMMQAGQHLENISNTGLQGSYKDSAAARDRSHADTAQRAQDYIATGGQLGYSPEQAKAAREMADSRFRASVMSHKWQQAHEEGKGEQFIEDLRTHPPANLTPIQQADLVKSVMGYAQEYKSALKGQQTINYVNALTAVDSGKMTDVGLLQAQRDLSEGDFAKLEHHITKVQAKKGLDAAKIDHFLENSNNAIAIAGTPAKVVNAAYEKRLQQLREQTGEAPTLQDAANVARGVKAKIPLFNEQLEAGIRSGDPNTSIQASQIYRSLGKLNPVSVDGIDAKSKAMALNMTNAIRRGTPAPEAYAAAFKSAQDVDQKVVEERGEKLKRELKGLSAWKNETVQEKSIANVMGFQREYMPPGVTSDFMDEVKNAYTNSIDMKLEDAMDVAKATLQRTYGPYNKKVMYLPPTIAYGGVSEPFVQNCFIENLHGLAKQFKGAEDLQSRYEVDDNFILPMREGFDINSLSRLTKETRDQTYIGLYKSLYKPAQMEELDVAMIAHGNDYIGDVPGKRVDRDGTVVEGVFSFRTDDYTDSIPPSYSIMFTPKGKRIPDPVPTPDNTYSQARFSITEAQMKRGAYETRTREEAAEAKEKPYRERQAAIEAMREQTGELDVEFP